jgi:cytoskeletal protein CcmA (bactofilin family)
MGPQHSPFSSLPSHVTPSASGGGGNDVGTAAKRSWLTKVLLVLLAIIIIAAIIFLVFLLRYQPKAQTSPSTGTLTDLKPDELAKIAGTSSTIGAGNQTLKIAGDTEIAGSAAFDKDVTVKGAFNLNGTFAPASLSVSGATLLQSGATVGKFMNLTGNLNVTGTSTFAGAISADSLSVAKLVNIGDLTFGRHLISGGSTPTIDVFSGNTGTISGTDSAGTVSINVSNLTPGQLVRINFKSPYTSTPRVSLTPTSINAASARYYVAKSITNATIVIISPLSTGDYSFDYFVTQ